MITENLSTLKIHKLTQAQYDRELAAGRIDENALYLTPDEEIDLSKYATKEELNTKSNTDHNHDDVYYTETEVDTLLSNKANTNHNHDNTYDVKGSADTALASAKSYTDTKTSSLASTTVVDNKISTHNTSTSAHNDIRNLISGLTTRLNTLADSDDTTLDQMSEIVEYIKSNKTLIDSVTTSKVNVSDIVNNLTTNVTNKPLSAAQGVTIKNLIDTLQSELDSHTHEIADVSGLQSALDGKASSSHTHNYAGSSSAGGAATSANKVNTSLTVILNGGTTEGTNQFTFDGSSAKSVHITASSIGAATSAHNHSASNITNGTLSSDRLPTIPIAKGGTGANTAATALTNLGITATATELNKLDGVTATTAELNYVDGVTSNIQTQLDGKSSTSHTHDDYMTKVNPTGTGSFNMNRLADSTVGECSSTFGKGCEASGDYSFAYGHGGTIGQYTYSAPVASGECAFAGGYHTVASGLNSFAIGQHSEASGNCAYAEGADCIASGFVSHAEGNGTKASGDYSHAEGYHTEALANQHAQGHYNKTSTAGSTTGTTGNAFIIGCGTSSSTANAMRVTYAGQIYAAKTSIITGADYAEYFEWEDGNPNSEDRRGYFVTLDGSKIKIANPNDYILGIISALPCIIGNGDEDWRGRYILDEFGAFIEEEFEYEEEIINESGEVEKVVKTGTKYKESPDYDSTLPYVQREDRPEWDTVGMMGVLAVRDDGTCQVNGFCTISDGGIATASETGYRVIERVTDNVVKVIFR